MSKKTRGQRSVRQPLTELTWLGGDESFLHFKASELQLQSLTPAQLESMQLRGSTFTDDEDEEDDQVANEFGDYGYMVSRALGDFSNVAILDISGSLVPKDSWINRYYGRVSYEEIRGASLAALKAGADAMLVNLDTGGGAATGIMELSDFWNELDKKMAIYTYTGTNMLSGGYWLGSMGRRIYANQMAMVGSIGVITAHFSYARALKESGVDVTMIRAGEFKALGSPYEKLDDVAQAEIQSRLNRTYEMFTGHVSAERNIPVDRLIETAAEGRVFMAVDAIEVGLVDAVMSFDAVVEDVSKRARKSRPTGPTFQSSNVKGVDMKRSLNAAGVAAVANGVALEEALKDPALSQEGEAAPAPEAATSAVPEEAAAPATVTLESTTSDHANLIDRVIELSTKLATAEAALGTAQAEVANVQSSQTALMKIAADGVNRMCIAMGMATVKAEDFTPQSMIALAARTQSQFGERFRVGAQAEVAADEDVGTVKPAVRAALPSALVQL